MITRLHVEGYKSLKDLDLELCPLNVMIGPNGSGKSNTIDVLSLMSESAQERLVDAVGNRGGERMLWRFEAPFVRVGIQASPASYSARIVFHDGQPCVDEETVSGDPIGPRPLIERFSDGTTSLREDRAAQETNPRSYRKDELLLQDGWQPQHWPEVAHLKRLLGQTRRYSRLDIGPGAEVRRPQPPRQEYTVDPSGDNLVSVLHRWATDDASSDLLAPINDALRVAFSEFDRLQFPPEGGEGYIGLRWHVDGLSRGLTVKQLSDGTVLFLWLLAILHQPPTGGIIMIEEPEIGLHPDLIRILAETLKSVASEEKQFLISTHSPELVSWLEPENVLVVEKDEEGATQARRLDREGLGAWLDSYTLGELWRMGEVGGRPW